MDTIEIVILVIAALIVFAIGIYMGLGLGKNIGKNEAEKKLINIIPEIRKDAINRSRAVLSGQFSEQLAPFLPNFPYFPTEARFIGKPVDFIVFKGLDGRDINEIVFVEVKSGKSVLNQNEKSLKSAIENGRVRWEEYRIPESLTSPR